MRFRDVCYGPGHKSARSFVNSFPPLVVGFTPPAGRRVQTHKTKIPGLCLDVRGYYSRRFHVQSFGHVFQALIKLPRKKSQYLSRRGTICKCKRKIKNKTLTTER